MSGGELRIVRELNKLFPGIDLAVGFNKDNNEIYAYAVREKES